jgi:DNA-binding PucR family transcriptional regulator
VWSEPQRELGPLLADQRMGEELIETLEVYLGSKQNIRETARRLHLAPRTVAYRLERIETLLGVRLDGEITMRLGAALIALRVTRETGGMEPAVIDER